MRTEVDLVQQEQTSVYYYEPMTNEWKEWFTAEWIEVMICAKAKKYHGNYALAMKELITKL